MSPSTIVNGVVNILLFVLPAPLFAWLDRPRRKRD